MLVPFRILIAALGIAAVAAGAAAEGDWPHWRGPATSGVSTEKGLTTTWSATENIRWRTPMPGPAGASPVVAAGRVFTTAQAWDQLVLLAIDAATGEKLWRKVVSIGEASFRGDEGNLASPSPVTDGEVVVATMGDGRMAGFTVGGEELWKLDLGERLTPLDIQFGYASTPILDGGRVYVQWVHGDGDPSTHEARVACLDARSGETIWVIERITGASAECEHSYASPVLAGEGDQRVLVTHGADYAVAYHLTDGAEAWRVGGLNSPGNYHATLRFVASCGVGPGLVVVPSAKNGGVVAVGLGGEGDLTGGPRELWRLASGTPDVPSPVVHDGLVYLCGEGGNLTCLDAATGDRVYLKRTEADRHRASPLVADGKVYLTSRSGVVTVVREGRKFEVLARNDLGEPAAASPAVSGGVLYLRTDEALYAIAEPKTQPKSE